MESEKAIFAGGCFWCLEAVFKRLKGVLSAVPGYTGGITENPNYYSVSEGKTGYAEAVEVTFSPLIISYGMLLEVFFAMHDPTQLNRQGVDIGTQYRSAMYYIGKNQQKVAFEKINSLRRDFREKIVTELLPFEKFYPAESYHEDYFSKNREEPYCSLVISPKIGKLEKMFPELVSG